MQSGALPAPIPCFSHRHPCTNPIFPFATTLPKIWCAHFALRPCAGPCTAGTGTSTGFRRRRRRYMFSLFLPTFPFHFPFHFSFSLFLSTFPFHFPSQSSSFPFRAPLCFLLPFRCPLLTCPFRCPLLTYVLFPKCTVPAACPNNDGTATNAAACACA